jgi:hypothetical protein
MFDALEMLCHSCPSKYKVLIPVPSTESTQILIYYNKPKIALIL